METGTVTVQNAGSPWLPGVMGQALPAQLPAQLAGQATADGLAFRPSASVLGFEPDMGALLKFRSQMALHGQPVQVARMCFDRRYAFERIAQAHACGEDRLRRLALELFQAYHRREESGPQAN